MSTMCTFVSPPARPHLASRGVGQRLQLLVPSVLALQLAVDLASRESDHFQKPRRPVVPVWIPCHVPVKARDIRADGASFDASLHAIAGPKDRGGGGGVGGGRRVRKGTQAALGSLKHQAGKCARAYDPDLPLEDI